MIFLQIIQIIKLIINHNLFFFYFILMTTKFNTIGATNDLATEQTLIAVKDVLTNGTINVSSSGGGSENLNTFKNVSISTGTGIIDNGTLRTTIATGTTLNVDINNNPDVNVINTPNVNISSSINLPTTISNTPDVNVANTANVNVTNTVPVSIASEIQSNITKINNTSITTNNGNVDVGTQRVILAEDQQFPGTASLPVQIKHNYGGKFYLNIKAFNPPINTSEQTLDGGHWNFRNIATGSLTLGYLLPSTQNDELWIKSTSAQDSFLNGTGVRQVEVNFYNSPIDLSLSSVVVSLQGLTPVQVSPSCYRLKNVLVTNVGTNNCNQGIIRATNNNLLDETFWQGSMELRTNRWDTSGLYIPVPTLPFKDGTRVFNNIHFDNLQLSTLHNGEDSKTDPDEIEIQMYVKQSLSSTLWTQLNQWYFNRTQTTNLDLNNLEIPLSMFGLDIVFTYFRATIDHIVDVHGVLTGHVE